MSETFLRIIILLIVIVVLLWFYQSYHESYLESDPVVTKLKSKLLPVFPELSSGVNVLKGDKSYTLSKSKIFLCTHDPITGAEYPENFLTFVLLHELAHCLNKEIGHGSAFQTIFQNLLDRAERYGLYDSTSPKVENYCKTEKEMRT